MNVPVRSKAATVRLVRCFITFLPSGVHSFVATRQANSVPNVVRGGESDLRESWSDDVPGTTRERGTAASYEQSSTASRTSPPSEPVEVVAAVEARDFRPLAAARVPLVASPLWRLRQSSGVGATVRLERKSEI